MPKKVRVGLHQIKMTRNRKISHSIKRIGLALFVPCALLGGLFACTNNPFNPAAKLRIISVGSSDANATSTSNTGQPIGITQTFTVTGELTTVKYTFAEPLITYENKPLLPRVNFTKTIVSYTLAGGLNVPPREFQINANSKAPLITGGATTTAPVSEQLLLKILSTNSDILATVYPADSVNRITEGKADIILVGKDDNGYTVTLEVAVPLIFSSTGSVPTTPLPTPTPATVSGSSPSPSASPSRG